MIRRIIIDTQSATNFFHFLRPLWLWALPFLWALVTWKARRASNNGQWARLIDPHLLPLLELPDSSGSAKHSKHWLTAYLDTISPWPWLGVCWSLAIIALAGPTWSQYSSPAFHNTADWVLILDLSPSMDNTDLSPSRAGRSRFIIQDVLDAAHGARVGLIVFGEDPYTVSPLTEDMATLRALLPPLSPNILPSMGDRVAPALKQAEQLLQQAGMQRGHIIVLSDGFSDPAGAFKTAQNLRVSGKTIDVIGIGPAFPKGPSSPALDSDVMRRLASTGGGHYVDLAQLPLWLKELSSQSELGQGSEAEKDITVNHWKDAGIWFIPLVLLLAAFLSRKGWL